VFKNQVGKARALDNPSRIIAYGLVGSSDILGLHQGRFLSIECKVGRDKLRPAQESWRDTVRRHGGLWCEARSVEDALALIA
jgi:hypothetical protein